MRDRLRALRRQDRVSQARPGEFDPGEAPAVPQEMSADRRLEGGSQVEEVEQADQLLTDEELADLALAADPDTRVAREAVPLHELLGPNEGADAEGLLPAWYMPPVAAPSGVRGWRRRVVLLLVVSLVLVVAYGLCSAYGLLGLG